MNNRAVKKCLSCGGEFSVKRSHAHKSFYCSKGCMATDYKKRMIGEKNPNFKNAGARVCVWCGETYNSYNKRRKFCSLDCSHKSQRKNKTSTKKDHKSKTKKREYFCKQCGDKTTKGRTYCVDCSPRGKTYNRLCKTCGKTYEALKSGNKYYCSMKCAGVGRRGKGNPNYKHGLKPISKMIRDCHKNRELIKHILKRDKYVCQKCGQIGHELHVDHIYPFNKIFKEFLNLNSNIKDKRQLFSLSLKYGPFWDEENMRVLCKKCNTTRPYKNISRNKVVEA